MLGCIAPSKTFRDYFPVSNSEHQNWTVDRGVRRATWYTSAMQMTHIDLWQKVAAELDGYSAPEPHPEAIGSHLPPSWLSGRLAEMRTALVMPRAAKVRDCVEETGELIIVDVMIVADDGEGTIVAYDLQADTFVLASIDPDPDQTRAVDAVSCGVRGSAVDCFLAA